MQKHQYYYVLTYRLRSPGLLVRTRRGSDSSLILKRPSFIPIYQSRGVLTAAAVPSNGSTLPSDTARLVD